jgi:hypothetical protein
LLLQLATIDKVFIIDLRAFTYATNEQLAAISWLFEDLFSNAEIKKVGWAFNNDPHMIAAAAKGLLKKYLGYNRNSIHGFIELSTLVKNPGSKSSNNLSLSDACLLILGKELNKDQCMSNWDYRPLSKEQLIYAALDAHCLLAVFDRLQKQR